MDIEQEHGHLLYSLHTTTRDSYMFTEWLH